MTDNRGHDIVRIEECSLLNSRHAHADGYDRAVCACGWRSTPARHDVVVAMHTAHAARELSVKKQPQKAPPTSMPDYVHHVRKYESDETWCGVPARGWCFIDLEHILRHTEKAGRLLACPACCDAIEELLQKGRWSNTPEG